MTPQRPFPLPPVRQQGRDYGITPVFQSGPMQPRKDVESFDLTRNFGPSRSMVTGNRSLTANPNGRMGAPKLDAMGDVIGSRGMTPQRLSEMAGRRLSSAMRAGDMRATELLYRGPMGFGRGFGPPPQGRMPQGPVPPGFSPPPTTVNNGQPPSTVPVQPPDPLANLEPPATTAQALGWPLEEPPQRPAGQPAPNPMIPPRMPWEGQPLPEAKEAFLSGQTTTLPPSPFNGFDGLPPPPEYSEQQVGGFNVLTGPDGKGGRKFLNAYTDPNRGGPPPLSAAEMGRIRAAGFQPAQVGGRMFDAQGVPYLEPLPQAPVPTERVTERSADGTTRTYTQPRGAQAAPTAAATAQDRLNRLREKAGLGGAQASTQTAQMPNVAYSNDQEPLTLDAARDEYSRTGDDTLLRQYFAENPRPVTRPYGQYPNIAVPQRPAVPAMPAMPVMQAPPRPGTDVPQAIKNPQGVAAKMQRAGPAIERATTLAQAAPRAAAALMMQPFSGGADSMRRWLQERAARNPQGIMAGINDFVQ